MYATIDMLQFYSISIDIYYRLLTFVVDLAVHGGAGGFAVRFRRLEIDICAYGSMQQRLRRSIIIAQRRLRVIGTTLHQAAQSVQLQGTKNEESR